MGNNVMQQQSNQNHGKRRQIWIQLPGTIQEKLIFDKVQYYNRETVQTGQNVNSRTKKFQRQSLCYHILYWYVYTLKIYPVMSWNKSKNKQTTIFWFHLL